MSFDERHFHGWLREQIQAAESYGLIDLRGRGWWDLSETEQLRHAAYWLCELKTRADAGDAGAETFFRLFNRPAPPHVPTAEMDRARLPGRLIVITSYFNPCGFERRRTNYDRFAQGLASQGVELWTIELSFDGRFELPEGPRRFRVRGASRNLMWQKERLLTILLEQLPRDVDKVAWVDCDVVFENQDWARVTSEVLERVVVAQLFDEVVFLGPDYAPSVWGRSATQRGVIASNVWKFGDAHPGFAWAARRSLLDRHGFVSDQIGGSGDAVMAIAWMGAFDHGQLSRYGDEMRRVILEWAKPVYEEVQGRVGYVPGRIRHLWHGSYDDRRYDDRLRALRAAGFDPRRHIAVDVRTGLYAWTDQAPRTLRTLMGDYFRDRREDGTEKAAQSPPVTCIMVTGHRAERLEYARQAAVSWAWQTYKPKRLVILNTNPDEVSVITPDLAECLEDCYGIDPFTQIAEHIWPWANDRTLGNLRNLAFQLADTDCVVQWDDDDVSHPGRLAYQVRHWREHTAVVFMHESHVSERTGEMVIATAEHWGCGGFPGTLMVDRRDAGLYPHDRKAEDTVLVERLRRSGSLISLDNPPTLYVRRWTGFNTWDEAHVIDDRKRDGGRPPTDTEIRLIRQLIERAETWNRSLLIASQK